MNKRMQDEKKYNSHWSVRSLKYMPKKVPPMKKQYKSSAGQQPLFDDIPIDHLKQHWGITPDETTDRQDGEGV